ncbi:MAG TPA: DUF58 domain-containing protein [Candidatus Limnocylindrales bacterium]
MKPGFLASLGLLLAGAILGVPVAGVLGVVGLTLEVVHWIWATRGLQGVRYARRLAAPRVAWGEEVALEVDVWNRKRLPLAWLRADDAASPGLLVRDRPTVETEDYGPTLRNTWTLAPYERVVRHLHVTADRRGVFTLGPVDIAVGDLFARPAATTQLDPIDTLLVWPRTVPAPPMIRPERWGDLDRARRGLVEDPSRFAGIRPYSPGDPIRRVHPRISERLGRPMTKRFEPSRERDVLIALDLQTETGRSWELSVDDDAVEELFVVAGSVARSLAAQHASFGLTAAGYSGLPRRFADVGVAQSAGQVERVLDLLARLSPTPSAPFETLLARIERRVSNGTTVLVISARGSGAFVRPLRRLARAGFGISILAVGPDAAANAAAARGAGFTARAAILDGPWPTATRLALT